MKKLEVKCLREYDDIEQRISLQDFEKLLKKEKLLMPTPDDLYWMWKQGTRIEPKYRPFWIRMPDGSAIPGYYFDDDYRFGAGLGDNYDYLGRFGGVGIRRVKK